MGKASEVAQRLSKPLTADQIRARRAAIAIADKDVVATEDGALEKRVPNESPRVVHQAPQQTWD